MVKAEWEIFILGTDEVVETNENYLDLLVKAKALSKKTGKTHVIGLHEETHRC